MNFKVIKAVLSIFKGTSTCLSLGTRSISFVCELCEPYSSVKTLCISCLSIWLIKKSTTEDFLFKWETCTVGS